ncbi:type II secretion system F family protein [Fluviispira multicolorata]|uniref:Type II secretion system protein GspF domain-containing protein n=1 Tax=Fluviispira multicolorata TaxID=2654512 RepID=A0A833JEH5_9BACT|nr:type II secretion system F family protein [Fluviispira multicolorata]KAB8033214.1 hypothetical protein GCL57_00520 [Fluviispira multicolorata]
MNLTTNEFYLTAILFISNFMLILQKNIDIKKIYLAIFPILTIFYPYAKKFYIHILSTLKLKQEEKRLISEIPTLIDFLSAYLKAGVQISEAMTLVAQKSLWSPTIKRILFIIISSYQQGMSFQESIKKAIDIRSSLLGKRHLNYVLNAIQLSHQNGSNLIRTLNQAKEKTKSSIFIEQKIKVLTAQMQLQATIISCVPIILFLIIYYISPSHITFFFHNKIGNILFILSLILNIIGIFFLKRITKIE